MIITGFLCIAIIGFTFWFITTDMTAVKTNRKRR